MRGPWFWIGLILGLAFMLLCPCGILGCGAEVAGTGGVEPPREVQAGRYYAPQDEGFLRPGPEAPPETPTPPPTLEPDPIYLGRGLGTGHKFSDHRPTSSGQRFYSWGPWAAVDVSRKGDLLGATLYVVVLDPETLEPLIHRRFDVLDVGYLESAGLYCYDGLQFVGCEEGESVLLDFPWETFLEISPDGATVLLEAWIL